MPTRQLVVAFDVETTGLSARLDRIVDVAAVCVETGESFSTLVNPSRAIPVRASAVHGIADRDVRQAPTWSTAADRLWAWLEARRRGRGVVFVAHNAPFDMAFLRAECGRSGAAIPPWVVGAYCSLKIARTRIELLRAQQEPYETPLSCRLSEIYRALFSADFPPHRALADAKALARVWGHPWMQNGKPREPHLFYTK